MVKKTAIYIVSTLLFCSFLLFNLTSFSVKNSIASDSLKQDSILKPDTVQVPGKDLPPKEEVKNVVDTTYKLIETGIGSWYGLGDGYHGKRTASGEIFDTYSMTAAHKKLKFGTIVRVTNLANGEWVDVKINDRGPFVKGRVIDLSYAAKQKIGMGGTAKVRLEQIIVE